MHAFVNVKIKPISQAVDILQLSPVLIKMAGASRAVVKQLEAILVSVWREPLLVR